MIDQQRSAEEKKLKHTHLQWECEPIRVRLRDAEADKTS